jgi:hypothetical protein
LQIDCKPAKSGILVLGNCLGRKWMEEAA